MFKKNALTICFSTLILVGCAANSSLPVDNASTPPPTKNNNAQCTEIDTTNTTLLTSGIAGIATLNPVFTLFVAGLTFFTIDSGAFDCNNKAI